MQVAPLLRASEVRALRELIKAAPAGFPYPGHGSLDFARGERKEIDEGGSRGDAETRSEVVPAAAQPVPSAVYPASPVDRGERACGAAQPLRVSAAPRAKLPSLDLKAAPIPRQARDERLALPLPVSAMDARFVRSVPTPLNAPPRLALPPGQTEARADPCTRCEGRWPIMRLHPIISACIETPCPMKALLPSARR